MNQGIPSRDIMTDRNGQITTIWLIFFERLYSLYLQVEQSNTDGLEAVKKIANEALQLAQQATSTNATQQSQINELVKKIDSGFVTQDQFNSLDQKVTSLEQEIDLIKNQLNALSQQFSTANISNQQKFTSLTQQINNLSALVATKLDDAPIDGKAYGRKDATWSEIIAVKLSLPFWLSDGQQSNIELTANYQLPFWLSDGTQQNIEMVVT